MGGYHGRFSFEAFSHRRTIMRRDDHRIFDVPIRYPPYTTGGLSLFRFAAKGGSLPSITGRTVALTCFLAVAAAVAVVLGIQYKQGNL